MQSGNADFSVTETSSTLHVVRFALVAEEDFVKLTDRSAACGSAPGRSGFCRVVWRAALARDYQLPGAGGQIVIRVVLVGAGYIAEAHLKGYLRLSNAQVVAVADVDASRARRMAAMAGGV